MFPDLKSDTHFCSKRLAMTRQTAKQWSKMHTRHAKTSRVKVHLAGHSYINFSLIICSTIKSSCSNSMLSSCYIIYYQVFLFELRLYPLLYQQRSFLNVISITPFIVSTMKSSSLNSMPYQLLSSFMASTMKFSIGARAVSSLLPQ